MESEEDEASYVSSRETNSTDSFGAKERSEESTAAPSVETQATVSHRSLETDVYNRRTSLHLKSEEEERVHSLSQKSSISSALKFSRHFASNKTDFVEEDDVSYDDTFDSLDSLSEAEDELSKTVEKTSSGNRSDSSSIGNQSDSHNIRSNSSGSQSNLRSNRSGSSGNRSNNSQLLSSHKEKTSIASRSKSSSSGAEDTFFSEEEDARSFSDRPESISSGEGGIRSLSSAVEEENGLPSLGLSSDSSVWSPSGSVSNLNTTDHSVEDKFTRYDNILICKIQLKILYKARKRGFLQVEMLFN